ncbi:MAG TPA: cupin domain-containing protein [Cytophagaceae bacterium]
MSTVSEILNILYKEGYTINFNLQDNCLVCSQTALQINSLDFVVDKHYRLESASDMADEAIIYAISSIKHNIKGTLVNGYGSSSAGPSDQMIEALREKTPHTIANQTESETEIKYNEATPQRPEGTRPLDAPMIAMDLEAFKDQIKREESYKDSDRNSITIFKSDTMRIVMMAFHEGAEMKRHTAPGTISLQVLEGKIIFNTADQSELLGKGNMITLHEGIPHSFVADEDAVILLTLASSTHK